TGDTPAVLSSGRQDRDYYRKMWRDLLERGQWQGEIWNRRKGGDIYPESLSIAAVSDGEGQTTHYIGIFSDVTDRKSTRLNSSLLHDAPPFLSGDTPAVLSSGRQDRDYYRKMWQDLLERGQWQGEIWNRRKGGDNYPEWLSIAAVRDGEGQTTHYIGIFSDVTERKDAEARIHHLAHHDALTGLPTRLLMQDRHGQPIRGAEPRGRPDGPLLKDLQPFKWINDTLGHDAGDHLLRTITQRCLKVLRESDTLARL